MRLNWSTLRSSEGMTLTELLVAVALIGVVVTAAFAGLLVINKGSEVSSSASIVAHDMSDPLEMMSRMIMQNNGLNTATVPQGWSSITPGQYQLLVWTNAKLGVTPELDAFYSTSAGELVWERWTYNSSKTAFTNHVRWVMSPDNANVAEGVPLFKYYDAEGTQITDMGQAASTTRYVVATTVSESGDNVYTDSRKILFRNRN